MATDGFAGAEIQLPGSFRLLYRHKRIEGLYPLKNDILSQQEQLKIAESLT